MYKIVRSAKEIEDVRAWAYDSFENGSHFHGMSYEEGVEAMLRWLVGETDDRPDSE